MRHNLDIVIKLDPVDQIIRRVVSLPVLPTGVLGGAGRSSSAGTATVLLAASAMLQPPLIHGVTQRIRHELAGLPVLF